MKIAEWRAFKRDVSFVLLSDRECLDLEESWKRP